LTTIVAIVKAKYSSKAVDANDDNDWIEEVADTWGCDTSFASIIRINLSIFWERR
jgi:hypothetical protein